MQSQVIDHKELSSQSSILALGELLPGVAHNFGNILMGVSATLELVAMHAASNSNLKELVQVIDGAMVHVSSGADLIQRLMLLSGGVPSVSTAVDLSEVVEHAICVCSTHHLAKKIILSNQFVNNETVALADPIQLEQVMINLILNALQASDSGEIRIGPCCIDDGMVGIYVKDEGYGIRAKDICKIFDPAFSKRRNGVRGTGLGLACSLAQVKNMGGHIDVQSEYGYGSTFTVLLPKWINQDSNTVLQKELINNSGGTCDAGV